jgi:hypothetical protein
MSFIPIAEGKRISRALARDTLGESVVWKINREIVKAKDRRNYISCMLFAGPQCSERVWSKSEEFLRSIRLEA